MATSTFHGGGSQVQVIESSMQVYTSMSRTHYAHIKCEMKIQSTADKTYKAQSKEKTCEEKCQNDKSRLLYILCLNPQPHLLQCHWKGLTSVAYCLEIGVFKKMSHQSSIQPSD